MDSRKCEGDKIFHSPAKYISTKYKPRMKLIPMKRGKKKKFYMLQMVLKLPTLLFLKVK